MSLVVNGFYDFCIDITDIKEDIKIHQLLNKLYQNGYRVIAINQTVDENIFEYKKKKKVKGTKCFLSEICNAYNKIKKNHSKQNNKLIILNRLTFVYSDSAKLRLLNQLQSVIQKFHLLAVTPRGNEALKFACTNSVVDIITLNALCIDYKMNRKLYSQAVERGLFFEVQYVDLISQYTRKAMIHAGHLLYIYGRCKNVIISSGAAVTTSIRNPYDVIILPLLEIYDSSANILGLNQVQAKACILEQCKHLLAISKGKKYGKAIFTISPDVENTELV